MTFTDAQTTTIQSWLSEKWFGVAKCPAGHDDAWSVAESMAFVPGFVSDEGGSRIAHESGFRFVVLTCQSCGYVAFLNADMVGTGA
jgi:hypothetical protein